jgi:hypothetical protein
MLCPVPRSLRGSKNHWAAFQLFVLSDTRIILNQPPETVGRQPDVLHGRNRR